ncbi:MAG TPA: hypothetical protein VLX68_17235 [Chitinivibrionales bacterium]|nr:hypothetical protein [Chitinivibrionales bacterium]
MAKNRIVISILCCVFLFDPPAFCSHPTEPLFDVVGASLCIFLGKISAAKKTDKYLTRDFVNYYYWVFTIKIDKVVKGDSTLKTFDFMEFPSDPACEIDTSKQETFLFFMSKSVRVAPGVTDWMVERQYKIVNGIFTPSFLQDETKPQPVKTIIKKIKKIVKEQQQQKK